MKRKTITKIAAISLSVASTFAFAPATFATNQYGIEYTGGEELGASNMQINPDLINSLTQVFSTDNTTITVPSGSGWEIGYAVSNLMPSEPCVQRYYVKVSQDIVNSGQSLSLSFSNSTYKLDISIENIITENLSNSIDEGEFLTVGLGKSSVVDSIGIATGARYSDASCQNLIPGARYLNGNGETKIYVETKLKLYKKDASGVWVPDNLYLGLVDFDASQSFKILNQSNLLNTDNMYAKSVAALQPSDSALKNMFVSSGNYLYSQQHFDTEATDIYIKINPETAQEGIKAVYGFARNGGSPINYYYSNNSAPADKGDEKKEEKEKTKVPNTGSSGFGTDFAKIIGGACVILPAFAIAIASYANGRRKSKVRFK